MWANGMIEYTARFLQASGECRVDKPLEAIMRQLILADSAFCFAVEILAKYILSLFPGR